MTVNDRMQHGYRYALTEPAGLNFDPEFRPDLTPKAMLELGVFGGKYMTDCQGEFPKSWFAGAKLAPGGHDRRLNYFGVNGIAATMPAADWARRTPARSSAGRP